MLRNECELWTTTERHRTKRRYTEIRFQRKIKGKLRRECMRNYIFRKNLPTKTAKETVTKEQRKRMGYIDWSKNSGQGKCLSQKWHLKFKFTVESIEKWLDIRKYTGERNICRELCPHKHKRNQIQKKYLHCTKDLRIK